LTMPIPGAAGKRNGAIAVYDISGKLVYHAQSNGNTRNGITTGLSKGIYIIKNNVK
jgi:hypothetical protein